MPLLPCNLAQNGSQVPLLLSAPYPSNLLLPSRYRSHRLFSPFFPHILQCKQGCLRCTYENECEMHSEVLGCCAWRTYELFEVYHPSPSSSPFIYLLLGMKMKMELVGSGLLSTSWSKKGEWAVKSHGVHTQEILHDRYLLFIYSFIHLFIYSFIRLFVYSFIRLFIYL